MTSCHPSRGGSSRRRRQGGGGLSSSRGMGYLGGARPGRKPAMSITKGIDSRPAAPGKPAGGHCLDGIFCPQSVAVVGVTATPGTVPYDIFYNILSGGYRGTVYPVAPGKRSISAVRAYRYVIDIPDPVDQAVIVFPADVVDRALQQCGRKGIKSVVVISAGFRELGPEGAAKEERLKQIAAEHGISLIGPNCLGVIN